MSTPQSGSISAPAGAALSESVNGLFWITAVLLVAAFFAMDHDLFISRHLPGYVDCGRDSPRRAAQVVTRGLASRRDAATLDASGMSSRFGFFGFGVLGCALLLTPARRPLRRPGVLVWLLAVHGMMYVSSSLWSESLPSTVQNLQPLFCFAVGGLGLARQFTVRDLAKLVVVVMMSYLTIGVAAEVILGSFNPQSAIYQFAGSVPPEVQGIQCALLILSALALLRHTRRNLPLHLGFIAIGVLFLLLTKSQASCCAFLVAVMVELFLQRPTTRKWLNGAWLAGFVLTLTAAGAFADRTRITEVLSNVGGLGAAACLLIASLGIWQAWWQYRKTNDEGYRFLVAQIVLGLVSSLFNTQYILPSLYAALCVASLASLAMTPNEAAEESSLPAIQPTKPLNQLASRLALAPGR